MLDLGVRVTSAAVLKAGGGASAPVDLLSALRAHVDGAGQSSIHDYVLSETVSSAWSSIDLSSNDNDHFQNTSFRVPVAIGPAGAQLAINDYLIQSITGGQFAVIVAARFLGGATDGNLISNSAAGTGFARYTENSSTAVFLSSVEIDGVPQATYGDIFDAIEPGDEVIFTVTGLDFDEFDEIWMGRNGSAGWPGWIRRVVWLETTEVSDLPAAISAAEAWVAAS